MSERAARRIDEMRSRITTAALTFESRWTMAALRRAEPGIAQRMDLALDLWRKALASGNEEEILRHGASVCRGYGKCVDHMAALGQPEDAYLFGASPRTGRVIAIGNKASVQRVAELRPGTPHYTVDEVAMLLEDAGADPVSAVKSLFPGAEVVEVRNGSKHG